MLYERKTYDAWLASAELPYDLLILLLQALKTSENVYASFEKSGNPVFQLIPDQYRKRMKDNAVDLTFSFFQNQMHKHGICSLTIEDADYPYVLREIPDPPGILFFQGERECLKKEKKIAMIGSRSASYSGKRAAAKIASDLSRNGVSVVSGFACGIDSECHRGCIEGGSPTIAVTGCGLDIDYPAQNRELRSEMLKKDGLILSEYAPGVKPLGWHFPYRNRIISGISNAVILMEAKIRSGSMTTVTHALNQGRDVFVYPGDPVSPLYEGNRLLLREGARFFTEADNILEDLNWLDNLPYIMQNSEGSANAVPENNCEAIVYHALEKGGLGFDELLNLSGVTPQELMSTLTIMQIKKMIEPLPGKQYRLKT